MPCIWGTHNKSQLFITVAIISPPPGVTDPQLILTSGSKTLFNALIDTGATGTCISPNVASALGLQPLGKMQIGGVSGPAYHNYYLFYVAFALGSIVPGTQQFQGQLHMFGKPIQGAELASGHGHFDVLLGMDIIGAGSLAVEGSGTFSFSF